MNSVFRPSWVRMTALFARVAVVCGFALTAAAVPTLTVVETPGDYYTVTAHDDAVPSTGYWEIKIDVASGGIFSFKDLTDAGDGGGGHNSYMFTNEAYNRSATMLSFDGRGGDVFRTGNAVADYADRISFEIAPDGSSFKVVYSETPAATDFFHDSYASGAESLSPGDLLTTITLTIRPPYSIGTLWDWSIACENVSAHGVTDKAWAAEYVFIRLHGGVVKTADTDTTDADGPWNAASPVSYARYIVGSNPGTGWTDGRQFILDYQTSLEAHGAGGAISADSWAGFDYQRYNSPFDYNTNLAAGDTRYATGQLIVDIVAPDGGLPGANADPAANAGPDQTLVDADRNGTEIATLDAAGSTDSDGAITTYEWHEAAVLLATGQTPSLTFALGAHTLTLTVTDDDLATDTDTVVITVNSPPAGTPIADAGADQGVVDADDSGSELVALDGSNSSDPDGFLVSWVWVEAAAQIATGQTAQADLTVGVHDIELTVTDNAALTSADTVTITVYSPEPAAMYCVDAVAGNDANPGTTELPWRTLDHAMQTADAGDTVHVRPGDYGEVILNASHNLGNPGGYILFQADPATCRPRPADWWTNPLAADWSDAADRPILRKLELEHAGGGMYLEFDGFDIVQDVSRTYGFLVGAKDNASHVRLRNLNIFCMWADNVSGIYFQRRAGSTTDFHNILVDGCFVRDSSSALRIAGLTKDNVVFSNNHLYHTDGSALQLLNGVSEDPIIVEHNHIHFQDPLWDPSGGGGAGDYSHGSGISIRRENLIIRRNIIHNHGTSRGIYTYTDGTTSPGGYSNIVFENNLLYDINNYPFELTTIGSNITIRNNTIIGADRPTQTRLGMRYYVAFIAKYHASSDGSTVQFYNNVIVGGVSDGIPFWGNWQEGNNIVWSTPFHYVSQFAPGSTSTILAGMDNMFAAYPQDYFEGSDNFFVGGTLFDTYAYITLPMTPNERIAHGQMLNDSFELAPGSPGIGVGDPAHTPTLDLLGNPRDPVAPSVGAFEYIDATSTPGDADGDGDVDLDDFVILKNSFGQSPLVDDRADFDGDGDIDLDDFVILKSNFGT